MATNCWTLSTRDYSRMLSTVVSRIKRGYHDTYVFAIDDQVVLCAAVKKEKIHQLENQGTLIGVYSATGVVRDDLALDISMVVDEIPDSDERL